MEALYTHEKGAHRLDPAVFEAFVDAVASVQAAKDQRDLRAIKYGRRVVAGHLDVEPLPHDLDHIAGAERLDVLSQAGLAEPLRLGAAGDPDGCPELRVAQVILKPAATATIGTDERLEEGGGLLQCNADGAQLIAPLLEKVGFCEHMR